MIVDIAAEPSGWSLPDRGRVSLLCLIATESALFSVFVVAYVFYMGKSLTGPTPAEVLELPVWPTVCLLSSSITAEQALRALKSRMSGAFNLWTAITILLGLGFLWQTAMEWRHLIVDRHLTIATNLFGTTFYSLVGLHASHVIFGVGLLSLTLVLGLKGSMDGEERRFGLLTWYWHFVDAVWIVVLTVVYVLGR